MLFVCVEYVSNKYADIEPTSIENTEKQTIVNSIVHLAQTTIQRSAQTYTTNTKTYKKDLQLMI